MDELKMTLSSKFMRMIVNKLLAKAIYKKTGYRVDMQINEIKVDAHDGNVRLHMDIDAEMKGDDLIDLLRSNDLL